MSDLGASIETTLGQLRDTTLGREDVDAILADLARHIGVERLELDQQGVAEITVDDDLDLTLLHLPHLPGLVAAAAVADEATGELMRRLLQANLSWTVTQGGSFAMLPGRAELMLCRLIALPERDALRLDRELAGFVDLVRAWRDEIEDQLEDEEEPDSEPPVGDRPERPTEFMRV